MKNKNHFAAPLIALYCVSTFAAPATDDTKREPRRPQDIVDLSRVIPTMQFDIRYFSNHNFVGRRIHGYDEPACLLTEGAASALKNVEAKLLPLGLTLKAYDCYRPQSAVDDFVHWAADPHATKMKAEFYVSVPKDRLFDEGYIAAHSGHSRGSTIDLTIVPLGSSISHVDDQTKLADCTAPAAARVPDNSLDFGTGYDCFNEASHPSFQNITAQAKANRLLLQSLMVDAGFVPLDTEWWHFTLKNEPYPSTYFNFPVRHIP
ncbi:M15 family metallopeptidase [Dyella sp.]|uniref:M15 family metallopeptidase n=1 Tax=Dyella sp. TaxID=1869338 RepID=UPI002D778B61|nr:M15 family metallopeptidase [Dyella sp.]HET7329273.1 M15 family metallopeptidase [Dyella sp.]